MQFIKNGKLYDTETAKWCGGYGKYINTPENEADIDRKYTLFKKRNGEFFILQEEYRTANGSEWLSENPIVTPLTEEEARAWSEEHISVYEYQEAFGPVTE